MGFKKQLMSGLTKKLYQTGRVGIIKIGEYDTTFNKVCLGSRQRRLWSSAESPEIICWVYIKSESNLPLDPYPLIASYVHARKKIFLYVRKQYREKSLYCWCGTEFPASLYRGLDFSAAIQHRAI